MRRAAMFSYVLVLLTLCLPAATTSAEQRQFGNVLYTVPDGWMKGKTREQSVVILAKDDDKFEGYIHIFRGEDKPDDIEAWLKKRMRDVLDEDERERNIQWIQTKEINQAGGHAVMGAMKVGKKVHTGVARKIGGRVEFFRYRVRLPDDPDEQARFKNSMAAFLNLCLTAEFISEGAKPLIGDPTPGPLQGAFMGQRTTFGLDGALNFVPTFFVFTKDGRFSDELPEGVAVAAFDPGDWLGTRPNDMGNYRVKGKQLTLHYADGRTEKESLDAIPDADEPLTLNGQTFARIAAPADGTRLDGYFQSLHYSGFSPGSGVQGGMAVERGYTFKPGGTFTANRFAGAFGNFDTGGGFATHNKQGKIHGTYDIQDGLLLLTTEEKVEGKNKKMIGQLSIVSITNNKLIYLDGEQFLNRSDDDD